MAGLLRRSLRWKPQLAEKTRSRDHNACDPRGQAGEQHKVAQEKRHATASPLPPRCRAILTVQDIPSSGIRLNHDEMFPVLRRGSDSWRGTDLATSHCPVELHLRLVVRMSSRAAYYRRRGLEAQQRATQTTEEKIEMRLKMSRKVGLSLPNDWIG